MSEAIRKRVQEVVQQGRLLLAGPQGVKVTGNPCERLRELCLLATVAWDLDYDDRHADVNIVEMVDEAIAREAENAVSVMQA